MAVVGTADLHIHTAQGDGMAEIPELLSYVDEETDLSVIAITDHDDLPPAPAVVALPACPPTAAASGPAPRPRGSEHSEEPPGAACSRRDGLVEAVGRLREQRN